MSELEHFAWNALTVSFILTIVMTLLFCYANGVQALKIWRLKSGYVVAVPIYLYLSALRPVMIAYGWRSGSLGLVTCGLLTVPTTAAMMIALVAYKRFTPVEKILAVAFIVAVALTVWAAFSASLGTLGAIYSVWFTGFAVICASQPLEIWRAKSAGTVTFWTVLAPIVGAVVWIIYAVALGDWILVAVNVPMLLIAAASFVLWTMYRGARVAR